MPSNTQTSQKGTYLGLVALLATMASTSADATDQLAATLTRGSSRLLPMIAGPSALRSRPVADPWQLLNKLSTLAYRAKAAVCDRLGGQTNVCGTELVDCSHNLGLPRPAMPQFTRDQELTDMEQLLAPRGIHTTMNAQLRFDQIADKTIAVHPIQNEISGKLERKICHLKNNHQWNEAFNQVPVIIVSSANDSSTKFILDGHHRAESWIVMNKLGMSVLGPVLPVVELVADDRFNDSRQAAQVIFDALKQDMPELFKGYGV